VIGNSDSIEYFRILGCEVYETEGGELTDEKYREVLGRNFKIILVTEEVFHRYREIIQQRSDRTFPVVSVIPDIHGAVWKDGRPVPGGVAFQELREAVIKAVGQDISGVDQES
ncbi:MAG TPA: V-type ATP synthase subunit F, partial [Candidatus Krumholzibacterium sp.]|nr:V-type ATP synthase subunit F [Candidatus Krumholzibacterium sp.]